MPLASGEMLMAFDVGLKRTGVAVGRSGSQTAQIAGSLLVKNGRHSVAALDQLIDEWQPVKVVIGDPKTANPHLNKAIRRVIHYLSERKLPVIRVDETLTSASANGELDGRKFNVKQKTDLRDQVAACLILETYLSILNSANQAN